MRGRGVVLVISVLIGGAVTAAPAAAGTYSNTTPILDPSSNVVGAHSLAPYPSTITVGGEEGTLTKARVTLFNVSGGPERDLDVLLAGPGGSSILLSDICSAGGVIPDFTGQTFTFDDDAATAIPGTCSSGPPSGTYKPSNYDTADDFPGIPSPYQLGLSNFRGVSPNGNWNLYAVDDAYPDAVTINGGWSLDVATTGPSPTAALTANPTVTGRRAAALRRCKKKFPPGKARRKCKRKARRLPL
jgi:hypothetical protein